MTQEFDGFKAGNTHHVKLPGQFFEELLPLIDDAAELKVVLFCFWALYQKEGEFRYLRRRDFINNQPLMEGLTNVFDPELVLDLALVRAVERGALVCADVNVNNRIERLYFLNTELGRKAVYNVKVGAWRPGDADNPIEILPERPNIFQLYEESIGLVSPMLREILKDAEDEYPPAWIQDAFKLAVTNNARRWAYVQAILERWSKEGRENKPYGADAKRSQPSGEEYVSGEFAAYIKYKPDES